MCSCQIDEDVFIICSALSSQGHRTIHTKNIAVLCGSMSKLSAEFHENLWRTFEIFLLIKQQNVLVDVRYSQMLFPSHPLNTLFLLRCRASHADVIRPLRVCLRAHFHPRPKQEVECGWFIYGESVWAPKSISSHYELSFINPTLWCHRWVSDFIQHTHKHTGHRKKNKYFNLNKTNGDLIKSEICLSALII